MLPGDFASGNDNPVVPYKIQTTSVTQQELIYDMNQ